MAEFMTVTDCEYKKDILLNLNLVRYFARYQDNDSVCVYMRGGGAIKISETYAEIVKKLKDFYGT